MNNGKIGKWHITKSHSNGKIVIANPTSKLKTKKIVGSTGKACKVIITHDSQGKLYHATGVGRKATDLPQKHSSLARAYKTLYSQEEQDISRVVQDLAKLAK